MSDRTERVEEARQRNEAEAQARAFQDRLCPAAGVSIAGAGG